MKERNNHHDMPYERYFRDGVETLSNQDLIAIILRSCSKDHPVMEVAGNILHLRSPNNNRLSVLYDLSLEELVSVPGVGTVTAVKILCLTELARRLSHEKREMRIRFDSPAAIADYYMEDLCHLATEQVYVLALNNRQELISRIRLSSGTADCSLVSPREVFRMASGVGAKMIVLMHNHPSGDPKPSKADVEITKRIAALGNMMEIPLIDHIIVGYRQYVSMLESGLLATDGRDEEFTAAEPGS